MIVANVSFLDNGRLLIYLWLQAVKFFKVQYENLNWIDLKKSPILRYRW